MENKLKTLKDITCNHRKGETWCIYCDITEELKQEAIKHGKALIKEQYDLGNFKKDSKNNWKHFNPRKYGRLMFIKEFFNITEEDLK